MDALIPSEASTLVDDEREVLERLRRLLDQRGGPTMTYRKSEVGMPVLVDASVAPPSPLPEPDLSNPEQLLAPVMPPPPIPGLGSTPTQTRRR